LNAVFSFFPDNKEGMQRIIFNFLSCLCFIFLYINTQAQSVFADDSKYKTDAAKRFSEALKIKTISNDEFTPFDTTAFLQLKSLMEKSFPLVHKNLKRFIINDFGYIYQWDGKNKTIDPYVFLAHQDVVPVEEAAVDSWTYPAFSGTIAKDTIWGRGAVDDKGTLMAILEAAEKLLGENIIPERTVYFCFGHDEETSGRLGAGSIVKWFKEKEIRPALVLDEGLEIIHKNYISFQKPVALIGVGEKGYASFEITATKPGGHSAAPENETAINILVNALKRINDNPMPARLTYPIKEFLQQIKYQLPGKMRFAISNLWLFKKKLLREMSKNNGTNSLIRTTMVTTILKSGMKDNVIPSFATATINCRIIPGETVADVETYLLKQIGDDRITLKKVGDYWDAAPQTSIGSQSYKTIDSLVKKMMPDVLTAPLFVVGTTDARYFRSISDGVINFIPVIDSKGMHGIDERRSLKDYFNLIHFFQQLMQL
jgi:carboxypeptidase PM20D1